VRATRGREREDRDDARAREEVEARKKEVMVLIGEEGYVWVGLWWMWEWWLEGEREGGDGKKVVSFRSSARAFVMSDASLWSSPRADP